MREFEDLLQHIEMESQTARKKLLRFPVSVSNEAFSQIFAGLDTYREQLAEVIGEQEASEVLSNIGMGSLTEAFKKRLLLRVGGLGEH